jgi:hypothetical protein
VQFDAEDVSGALVVVVVGAVNSVDAELFDLEI